MRMPTRNRSIDTFRGLSIVLMVFFTATLKLSRELPDPIRHNSSGAVHFGDFVLPMFLFASGLSLAYYLNKRTRGGREATGIDVFHRDVLTRFGKLAAVGIILSPWSTRGFLQMDEVMLSGLLFLACVVLYRLDWKPLMGMIFFINLSYLGLSELDWTGVFKDYYLGGYYAALYYLPVMLSGLIVGKNIISHGYWSPENGIIVILTAIMFAVSWSYLSIDKLSATPSFMMLSILLCLVLFGIIERVVGALGEGGELEYLGRRPIMYWIIMYAGFIIALKIWDTYSDSRLPLDLSWHIAVLSSVCLAVGLWLISKLYDQIGLKKT